jgi:phospholipid/cholesterol/gamma-HCH transport system substrate-binding protein
MIPSPVRDLTVGLFVFAGILAIAYLSVTVGGFRWTQGPQRTLYASFDEIGGLAPRAQVRIGGVKVGQVRRIELNGDFRARVVLEVNASLELPEDTSAAIHTSGLLGDQYLALEPGGEERNLEDGGEITYTQGAISIERLIGQLVQNFGVEE